jgi:hypothetical protein
VYSLSGIVTPFFGFAYRKLQKSFGAGRKLDCGDFGQPLMGLATIHGPKMPLEDTVLENNGCRSKYLF